MRWRTAAVIFAAIFAAAPALALAAELCSACCCPPTPCRASAGACDAMTLAATGCGGAPSSPAPLAKRAHDAPTLSTPAPALSAFLPEPAGRRLPMPGDDLLFRVSPLRLSVVLRI